ncbi:MAG: prepilin-type N-terminal cleavage/methylation domain-containing protein [Oligoflexia bacterium]|nr:prepilin-type N-terminal cleavage/methylation domain-containing protein [Oligoflexia bacterium]
MSRLPRFSKNVERRRGSEGGFTLLEVVIALAIMVLAFASILSVESGSINASARARQMNIVGMLAKSKMVETEYQIEGKSFEEIGKEAGGAFEAPYEDYRWTTAVKELEFPNLASGKQEQGAVAGSEGADMISGLLTKFLSQSVREVTVTVFWKRGNAEQSFALSTYWVDLNHEFSLSQ